MHCSTRDSCDIEKEHFMNRTCDPGSSGQTSPGTCESGSAWRTTILGTGEPGHTEKGTILVTCDPGNTRKATSVRTFGHVKIGKRTILVSCDAGNIEIPRYSEDM